MCEIHSAACKSVKITLLIGITLWPFCDASNQWNRTGDTEYALLVHLDRIEMIK